MGHHPVPRKLFFSVLEKYGFSLETMEDGSTRFVRPQTPTERHFVDDPVARGIVMRFAHKYTIPRVEFWPASLRAVVPDDIP
jgi:hypothetical protein